MRIKLYLITAVRAFVIIMSAVAFSVIVRCVNLDISSILLKTSICAIIA